MAPIKNIKTRETSRDILSASSRPTPSGQAGPRVIKNKAKDLARHGAQPWDDNLRQQLVDYHASFPTWDGVANMLCRSNQAIRLEWKRMLAGDRDQRKGGQWERKAKACEAQRKIDFPSRESRASNTAAIAPDAGEPAEDRDDDDPADAMRYQSLGSEDKGVEPHESRMLFREREAWVTARNGKVAYLHPWGFQKFWVGKVQLWPDVALKQPGQIAESCKGLSKGEIAASLREMGIGQ